MNTKTHPIDAAIAHWREGRPDAAFDALTAAKGDAESALFLLQVCDVPGAPADARQRTAEAMKAAPDTPQIRVRRAYMQAAGFEQAADPVAAISARKADARAGEAGALTEIALLALMTGAMEEADTLLEAAARAGAGHAIAALLRRAAETGVASPVALDRAQDLLAARHPLAQALGQAASVATRGEERPKTDYPGVLDSLTAERLAKAAEPAAEGRTHRLNETPRIERIEAAMPAVLCEYLAAGAASLLKPAQIFDPTTGEARPDPYRRSLTASLPESSMDIALWAFKARMAALSGQSVDKGEALSLLVYRGGEEYKPHFDYLSDDKGAGAADLAARGQRVATTLVRLNEEFQGGSTVFPELDIRWSGPRGEALSFDNVDDKGEGDPRTLHAGEPVTAGTKILASLWLRETAIGGG